MIATRRVCRDCDEPITDSDGATFLWHEPGMLGPGRHVYTHREHADLLAPDPARLRIPARALIAKALRSGR